LELVEGAPEAILIVEAPTFKKVSTLLQLVPNAQLFVIRPHEKKHRWLNKLFYSIRFLPSQESMEQLMKTSRLVLKEGLRPCFLLDQALPSSSSKLSLWKRLSSLSPFFIQMTVSNHTTVTFTPIEKP
jgi:hypothetical protein